MHAQAKQMSSVERLPAELVFLSPDRSQAQRVLTCLRRLGKIHWEPSPSPARMARHGKSTVMLLDFSVQQAEQSARLMTELMRLTPSAAVIAVGSINTDGSACVLSALRAGVKDFIDLDAPNLIDDARAAIEQALRQRDEHHHPALGVPSEASHGKVILLLGARAGVGTSTLAAHLGFMMQQRHAEMRDAREPADNHVLVMDLGEPGGDMALYLNMQSDFEITNAIDNAARFDATLARTALPRHKDGLAILSRPMETPPPVDGDPDFGILVDRLANLFDLVLIDGGGMAPSQLPATLVNLAQETWLVADQGLATMVSLDAMLRTVRQCGADSNHIRLVMNRCSPESGLSPEQVSERFKLPLLATLPDRGSRLRACANTGKLLCEATPHDRYLQAIKPMLDLLLATDQPSRHSWLQRAHKLWRS